MLNKKLYLQISKFGKRVDDDTEDDVETNSRDEDEERDVIDDNKSKHLEILLWVMLLQVLQIEV